MVGSLYLAVAVNALASLLAILTLLSYLFIYTPLKRRTSFCVLAGAFPGAIPPLIGWAASTDTLSIGAWALYAVLFLWQFPHFMAIAWMYRKDYARAGYMVLPKGRAKVRFVTVQSLLPLLVLIPFSLLATPLARLGLVYSIGALFLGLGFFCYVAQFVGRKSGPSARRLLLASILYLPSLFMLMVFSSAG
jgi:protoheme IX farnesyltransferase